MSRGFDGFEVDDFRDSQWHSNRGRGGSAHRDPNARPKLERIREIEYQSDQRRSDNRERQDVRPSPVTTRRSEILDMRNRTKYTDRDRTYSLRPSEIHTLTQIGTFRVVNIKDLEQLAYGGDRSCLDSDLRNLIEQRLVQKHQTSVFKKQSRQVLTLTKEGQRLLRQQEFVPEDQVIYSGLVKPKEAEHDADLFRMYRKAAEEIERKGGKVLRVQLDYELKEQLYRKLGEAQANGDRDIQRLKESLARQMYLPMIRGKVRLPDLRIEYVNQDVQISRVDLELATRYYHAGHLREKASAGFQLYARSEDAAGLRRVRDEREITVAILSL